MLACALLAGSPPGYPDPVDAQQTEQELKQVQTRIQSLQKALQRTTTRHTQAEAALRENELAISHIQMELRQLKSAIEQAQTTSRSLQADEQQLRIARETQRDALQQSLKVAFQTGRQGYIKLLLNQQRPEALGRAVTFHHYLQQAHLEKIQAFSATLTALKSNAEQQQKVLETLNLSRQSLQTQQAALENTRTRRSQTLAQLKAELQQSDSQLQRFKTIEKELENLLRAVRETLADLPAQLGSEPFSQLTGQLQWPVRGKLLKHFGQEREEGALRWNGVLIKAPAGSEVKAVHRGRVVFADWMRGYGLLIILDHGEQWLTLYGHNESLLHAPGAWVEAGETIAYSGSSGGQDQASTYFEIRHGGEPVNPVGWMAR